MENNRRGRRADAYIAAGMKVSAHLPISRGGGRSFERRDEDEDDSKQNWPNSIHTVVYSKFKRRGVKLLANFDKTGNDPS